MSIRLTLPLPPSVNHMYERGREGKVHLSEAVRVFRAETQLICAVANVAPIEGDVSLTLVFYFADKRSDLSNRIKAVEDAIQGYLFLNDRQIVDAHQRKLYDKNEPRVEVICQPFSEVENE